MVSAGAKGETLVEIQAGMNFPIQDDLNMGYSDTLPVLKSNENFTLEAANSVFVQKGFSLLSSYEDTLHQYFHATINPTDFQQADKAARFINDWVKDFTKDKIKEPIKASSLDALTRLVLV